MNKSSAGLILAFLATFAVCSVPEVRAQTGPPHATQILLVMPFENLSKMAGIDWMGESFPEVLANRLESSSLVLVSRADRLNALDRLGLPGTAKPSRATMYQVAQELDADYVLMGDYRLEAKTLTVHAQLMDVGRLRLSPELIESGPLDDLITIQTALTWDVLKSANLAGNIGKDQYVAQFTPIRLDALESYVRGVLALTAADRIKYFREASRLEPTRTLPMLQVGKTFYEAKDYQSAMTWLVKIPAGDAHGNEAQFYLGLSAFYTGQFERAEAAFSALASRLPLTEVYNNLGVAASRQGDKRARSYFEKTIQTDPNDPDYHFNLAVELYRQGEVQNAVKELRQVMALSPEAEAKSFLDQINSGQAVGRLPVERIKRNYDESSYRQLAMEIENATEVRLQKLDPAGRAAFRVERGRELLDQGVVAEAEKQFRAAVILDPTSASAHAGLARVLESIQDAAGARNEARMSLRLRPTAEAYLVMARLDLKENNSVSAQQNVQQALALDPANAGAISLQRDIAAGLAGKSRPPQP